MTDTPTEQQHRSIANLAIPIVPIPSRKQIMLFTAYAVALFIGGALVPEISSKVVEWAIGMGLLPDQVLETYPILYHVLDGDSYFNLLTDVMAFVGILGYAVWNTDFGEDGLYVTWLHLASAAVIFAVVFLFVMSLSTFSDISGIGSFGSSLMSLVMTSYVALWGLFFIIPAVLVSIGAVQSRADYRPLLVNVGIAGTLIHILDGVKSLFWVDGNFTLSTHDWANTLFQYSVEGFIYGVLLAMLALLSVIVLGRLHEHLRIPRESPRTETRRLDIES